MIRRLGAPLSWASTALLALAACSTGRDGEAGQGGTGAAAGSSAVGSGGTGGSSVGSGGTGSSTGGSGGAGGSAAGSGAAGHGGLGDSGVPTRYPATSIVSPVSDFVAQKARTIAEKHPGRQADVFMKVGDSHTVSKNLLHCFAGPAEPSYQLDLDGRDALLPSIEHFRKGKAGTTTPFSRASLAAMVGKTASWCIAGSPSPLAQETNALDPRFALVSYGTNDMQMGLTFASATWPFYESFSALLDELEQTGVVPIVAGLLPRADDATAALWAPIYDTITRGIAEARQIPYLSMYLATKDLPKQGLASDGVHGNVYSTGSGSQPCVLTAAGLGFNYNVRNLRTLEQLDVVKRVVVDSAAAPDAPVPPVAGQGEPASPWTIDGLPFTHASSTAGSKSDIIDVYPGCKSSADESGPERYYTLTVDQPTAIRAMLFDRQGTDVDLHLLAGGPSIAAGKDCIARHDRMIERTLAPGTYTFVVDTFVSQGQALPGGYLLVVVRCDPADTECK